MASVHVYGEIKGFLENLFTGVLEVVDYDGIRDDLQQGSNNFIVLEETSGEEDHICFGDPGDLGQRESGIIIVHYYTPSPESSVYARSGAESVQSGLRYQTINGVRILSVSPPDVTESNDGNWTIGFVSVTYQYDFNVAKP